MFPPHHDVTVPISKCPFCRKSGFKKLGNHLPYCKDRNGRDYSKYLSNKTLEKKARSTSKNNSSFCPRCHKRFQRVDTHLKNSAVCRSIPQEAPTGASSGPEAGCGPAHWTAASGPAGDCGAPDPASVCGSPQQSSHQPQPPVSTPQLVSTCQHSVSLFPSLQAAAPVGDDPPLAPASHQITPQASTSEELPHQLLPLERESRVFPCQVQLLATRTVTLTSHP